MPTRDEPVYIRVEKNEHILGTLLSPGTLIPGVLFVHGWGGDQHQYLDRARELAALGSVCLTFDLRGHAQTQALYEKVSREESLRDVLAAYDFLASQSSVDSDSIAVVGASYGGYLAALLTAMRPVKWLALCAPALYKDSEWAVPKSRLKLEQGLEGPRCRRARSGHLARLSQHPRCRRSQRARPHRRRSVVQRQRGTRRPECRRPAR